MAVVSPDDQVHCAGCGGVLGDETSAGDSSDDAVRRTDPPQGLLPNSVLAPIPTTAHSKPAHSESAHPKSAQPFDDVEAWELEEDLEHIGRTLRVISDPASRMPVSRPIVPANVIAASLPRLHRADSGVARPVDVRPADTGKPRLRSRGLPRLAGCLSFFGVACLSCGAALWIWSSFGARADLHGVGVRGTFAGALCLLMGAALHLDAIVRAKILHAERMEQQLTAAKALGRRRPATRTGRQA